MYSNTERPIIRAVGVSKRFCLKHRFAARIGLKILAHELLFRQRPSLARGLRAREFMSLSDVSLSVGRGEALAVVGQNGCGKTTLSRVLAGIYKPDAGRIEVNGKVTAIFAKGAGFSQALSGRENIFNNMTLLGASEAEIRGKLDDVISFADLPEGALEAPVRTYSSGMRARLGFACAVHTEPDLMIIDEALAVGDLQFRQKCYNRLADLRRRGLSFLIVSHNLKGLMQICDRAIYLHDGKVVADGPATQVITRYNSDLNAVVPDSLALPISQREAHGVDAAGAAQIRSFWFENGDGARATSLETGRPASLVVEVEALRPVQGLTMVAIVKDEQGELGNVTSLDSAAANGVWDLRSPGRYVVRAALPEVRLAAGSYVLKLFIAAGSHHNMLDAVERFPFDVLGEPTHALFTQSVDLVARETI